MIEKRCRCAQPGAKKLAVPRWGANNPFPHIWAHAEEDGSHGTQGRDQERVAEEGLAGISFGPTSRDIALGGLVSRYSFADLAAIETGLRFLGWDCPDITPPLAGPARPTESEETGE